MFTFTQVHHYTTVESLYGILDSKCLKFSPLSNLDDATEQMSSNARNLADYCFVSSWTSEETESLPMWKFYSNIKTGIRISMHIQPFAYNNTDTPSGLYPFTRNGVYLKDEIDINDEHFWVYDTSLLDNMLCNVVYTDRIGEIIPDVIIKHRFDRSFYGTRKYRYWDFQAEVRYRYFIIPEKFLIGDGGFKTASPSISEQIVIPDDYKYLKLRDEAFRKMRVTYAPCMTRMKKNEVKNRLKSYGIAETNISDSIFSGILKK